MAKRKVLVVDDEKDVCEVIKLMLEKGGYDTIISNEGKDALEKVKEIIPDLVLLDIILPDIDGFEILRMLKYNSETERVPIVVVSGMKDTASILRARELRSSDYITKPFTSEELLRSVNRCVGAY